MTALYADDWLTVHQGDCRTVMAEMPAESVHCVVTSPPYWGLRDYGTATWDGGDPACDHLARTGRGAQNLDRLGERLGTGGGHKASSDAAANSPYRDTCRRCSAIRVDNQLGLEPTQEAYVANLVEVFREVRRVLRPDGTVWLNLGDSYASHDPGGYREFLNPGGRPPVKGQARNRAGNYRPGGLKPKDLVGIPWRVAFALQADGWYLRSDIIWSKPNPMPESVTDRPTKSHEMVFLLSKSPRYYFDSDAVREGVGEAGVVEGSDGDGESLVFGQNGRLQSASPHANAIGVRLAASILDLAQRQDELGLPPLDTEVRQQGPDDLAGAAVVGVPVMRRAAAEAARFADGDIPAKEFLRQMDGLCVALPDGHDLKEAWRTSRASRPAIDADGDGSVAVDDAREVGQLQLIHDEQYTARPTPRSRGRVVERGVQAFATANNSGGFPTSSGRNIRSVWTVATQPYPGAHFATFPAKLVEPCIKAGSPEAGTVLDPFAGSGTTGMVAQSLSRRAVLIDLNADYLIQAMGRNRDIPLGLAG